jgi:hypothetical protein
MCALGKMRAESFKAVRSRYKQHNGDFAS